MNNRLRIFDTAEGKYIEHSYVTVMADGAVKIAILTGENHWKCRHVIVQEEPGRYRFEYGSDFMDVNGTRLYDGDLVWPLFHGVGYSKLGQVLYDRESGRWVVTNVDKCAICSNARNIDTGKKTNDNYDLLRAGNEHDGRSHGDRCRILRDYLEKQKAKGRAEDHFRDAAEMMGLAFLAFVMWMAVK